MEVYPLVMSQLAIENDPVEIVDFPNQKMVVFHSYVNVYQRVHSHGKIHHFNRYILTISIRVIFHSYVE